MHLNLHMNRDLVRMADLPLVVAGFAAPYLFLGLLLLERDYRLYEGIIGFFSSSYGIEFLLVNSDMIFLTLPFAGLILAVVARLLLGRGNDLLNFMAYVSVRINLLLAGFSALAVTLLFLP